MRLIVVLGWWPGNVSLTWPVTVALISVGLFACRTRLPEEKPIPVEEGVESYCTKDYEVSHDGDAVGMPADELALGDHFSCARAGGDVFCWGYNEAGQLGDGTLISRSRPVRTKLVGAIQIASGPAFDVCGGTRMSHTCALLGDGRVSCWGSNIEGADLDTAHPTEVPTIVEGVSNATQVAVGGWRQCALLADRTVRCWGRDPLGDSDTWARGPRGPVAVRNLAGVRQVAVGEFDNCALLDGGAVSCWGYGEHGALGDGTLQDRLVPGPLVTALDDAVALVHAWGTPCAIRPGGNVACWGYALDGDGLLGADMNQPEPVHVSGLDGVVQVAVAGSKACAVLDDRTVACWGRPFTGKIGSPRPPAPPARVPGLVDIVEVKVAGDHACARDSAGAVWCWGSNSAGQLGDGTTVARNTPRRVW